MVWEVIKQKIEVKFQLMITYACYMFLESWDQFYNHDEILFYFMFQVIWNRLEGYYFVVEKLIILVEWGRPPPPVKNSI